VTLATKSRLKRVSRRRPGALAADFGKVWSRLAEQYPEAHCALNFANPFQLLVATVLSAQCTDERVNQVTPALFARFKRPSEMAKAPVEEIEVLIRSTGFYKNKAKNLKAACAILENDFADAIPARLEDLVLLPGVGRKTANVVLGNAFGIASGVVVDTHVTRLANRWGWVRGEDAVKIEAQLNELCPQKHWIMLSHYLIAHGRAVCKARSPQCQNCFLANDCPKRGIKLT
jgi:endonuclease III